MEINKKIILIDAVLVLGSLLVIAGIVGYTQAFVVAPIESDSTIFVFENVHTLIIDDNLDFDSPESIDLSEDIVVSFPPGNYYWKIIGDETEIRQLTIEFDLQILFDVNSNGEVRVLNSGDKNIDVSVYNQGVFSGTKLIFGVEK